MSDSARCPHDESFVRFLEGQAAEADRDRIARHADACSECALVLAAPRATHPTGGGKSDAVLTAAFRGGDLVGGRYRIRRLLGAGGMGEVYEAYDQSLSELVAVKTVRATIADNPRAVDRLKLEVQLAHRVTHPNVCRVFDFGVHQPALSEDAPVPFLTMELLPGTTLAARLRERGPMVHTEIVQIAQQIAAGLAAAHKVGVIHKDCKSDNIILVETTDGSRRAALTDFGLAEVRSVAGAGTWQGLQFSGTPGYLAPERLAGAPATESSDVYALGVVLVDMITGRIAAGPPRPSSLVAANLGLLALAQRCQAVAPEARPSLVEVLRALEPSRKLMAGGGWPRVGWAAAAAIVLGLASLMLSGSSRGIAADTEVNGSGKRPIASAGASPATAPHQAAPSQAQPAWRRSPPLPRVSMRAQMGRLPARRPHSATTPATQPSAEAAAATPPTGPTLDNQPIRSLLPAVRDGKIDDVAIDPFANAR